ncbi:hypothetical protein R1flu_005625 [Riccia fluitans]|uniref:Rieske domain-containing protein n=1 Tax=Riccia fluitans TaxID=41844 RepID=A0ABD1YU93_9MARC
MQSLQGLRAAPSAAAAVAFSGAATTQSSRNEVVGHHRASPRIRERRRSIRSGIVCGERRKLQTSKNSPSASSFGSSDLRTAALVLRLWNAVHRGNSLRSVSPTAAEPTVEEDIAPAAFNWATNWYPVIPVEDFDRSVPYPFHILGRKVVFWCDKEGNFSCVLDACPHRLAPLSEGRVDEDGCLSCSYHGWSFKGDGSCAKIPQARPEGPEAKACDQKKSRAVALPVVVKQGILFVWPDENSPELASKTEPPITPAVDGEGWCAVETFRDLYYNYDTGMENLVDPSHVPVAHHNVNGGIVGNRKQASWLDLEVQKEGVFGFNAIMKKTVGPPSVHTFEAPSRFAYEFELKNIKNARAATVTYCTPTLPGSCRIIVVNARNFMIGLSSGPKWWQLFPRWLDHQLMLNLLDGDAALLHGQERYLAERVDGKPETWAKAFFMPASSDRYVGAFRTWLTRFGGNKVGWFPGVDERLPPLITKKEDLLNRYTSHTQYCKHCRKALANFEFARKVLFGLAVTALAVGVMSDPSHRLKAVVFSVVSGAIGWWLGGWIQMFHYKGYDHGRIP